MLRKILQNLLYRFGKTYTLDQDIPNKLIISFLIKRVLMIIRGFIKTKRKIFIGKHVSLLNAKNFQFGYGCTIEKNSFIDCYASEKIIFGDVVKIGAFSTISSTSHLSKYGKGLLIGNNSAVGEYSYFGCSGGITIGDDVIMGQYISFHSENHNFSDSNKLIREQGVASIGIDIGNNVWVGSKATFLDGSKVGHNSIVAAGSLVNKVFPPNVIIGGVPAKVIKNLNG